MEEKEKEFIGKNLIGKNVILCLVKPPQERGLASQGIVLQNQYLTIKGIDDLGVWTYIPPLKRYMVFSDGRKPVETEFASVVLIRWDYINSIVVPDTEIKDTEKLIGFTPGPKEGTA